MSKAGDNAIGKAVTVLRALSINVDGGSARELAAATGIARSTVQRILTTLAETGMVSQDPSTQRYRIGPEALVIGLGYRQGLTLVNLARPLMVCVRDRTGETVGLSVAVGDARVFIAEVVSASELRFASELGRLYPLWSGANGRVLLGGLTDQEVDRILDNQDLAAEVHRPLSAAEIRAEVHLARADGYCLARSESIDGVSSVAVPVRDTAGSVIAALSVSGPENRLSADRLVSDVLPSVADAARRLGAAC